MDRRNNNNDNNNDNNNNEEDNVNEAGVQTNLEVWRSDHSNWVGSQEELDRGTSSAKQTKKEDFVFVETFADDNNLPDNKATTTKASITDMRVNTVTNQVNQDDETKGEEISINAEADDGRSRYDREVPGRRYDFYLSHMQMEGSGDARTLYNTLQARGIRVWYDMSQKNIDANSMMQGIIDSDVFVILLTNSYMSQWYCLLEFATAIYYHKPIIVIVEENQMFNPWDLTRWQNNILSRKTDHKNAEDRGWERSMKFDKNGKKMVSTLQNTYEDLETKDMGFSQFRALRGFPNTAKHLRDKIIEKYNENLMIPHRRRGFEYTSMLHELLRRANFSNVPTLDTSVFTRVQHKFTAIYTQGSTTNPDIISGEAIGKDIIKSLEEDMKQKHTLDIASTEYVIVILTGGFLEDPVCLDVFQTIFTNRSDLLNAKKIIFIMSKPDGWTFQPSKKEREMNDATANKIRKLLSGYEVMSYRPKGGNRNYEHDAMIYEMLKRLGLGMGTGNTSMDVFQNVQEIITSESSQKMQYVLFNLISELKNNPSVKFTKSNEDHKEQIPLQNVCEFEYPTMAVGEKEEILHLKCIQLLYEKTDPNYRNKYGYDRKEIVRYGCKWPKVKQWAETIDAIYGRYEIDSGPPVHQSATCHVVFAKDVLANTDQNDARVALKIMRNQNEFLREIKSRYQQGRYDMNDCTIRVLGWHVPADDTSVINSEEVLRDGVVSDLERSERTNISSENFYKNKFVLVMECASSSLFHDLASQRIAGYDINEVRNIFISISKCVQQLHKKHKLVHSDLKPRNILRKRSTRENIENRYILCDLDATFSQNGGEVRTDEFKCSTAYCAPEYAQYYFKAVESPPQMSNAYDIWSLGVILYELCTGQNLFQQDISNDNLVNENDETILCAWHTIPDKYLDLVFRSKSNDGGNAQIINDAKDLIRWCLKGKQGDRPKSLDDILTHRFLISSAQSEFILYRPMKYHMFVSHSQAEASGEIGTLFESLQRQGIHVWRDMSQKNIDANSMIQGVIDSDVFIILLTNSYMSRWYCLLEFATAMLYEKPIVVIVEENSTFWQWDLNRWQNNECSRVMDKTNAEDRGWKSSIETSWFGFKKNSLLQNTYEELDTKSMGFTEYKAFKEKENFANEYGTATKLRVEIEKIHSENKMMPHRRRGFEYKSMMNELLKRAKIAIPPPEIIKFPTQKFMIINTTSGAVIADEIKASLTNIATLNQSIVQDVNTADYILVVLTKGILEDSACLNNLEKVLPKIEKKKVIFIMSKDDGWSFRASKAEEQYEVAGNIRAELPGVEIMTYRPLRNGSKREYEHHSMMLEMMKRFNVAYGV